MLKVLFGQEMSRLVNFYVRMLEKRPLVSQALISGSLMTAGDVTSQFLIEKKTVKEFSVKRSAKFLVFGTLLVGPALRKWYAFLDAFVKRPAPVGVFAKMAMDQLLFGPTFICVFLSTMTYWTTYSTDAVVCKLENDFRNVLFTSYKIWPVTQLINFYMIPPRHRILFVSTVAYFWNTYLAYKTSQ